LDVDFFYTNLYTCGLHKNVCAAITQNISVVLTAKILDISSNINFLDISFFIERSFNLLHDLYQYSQSKRGLLSIMKFIVGLNQS